MKNIMFLLAVLLVVAGNAFAVEREPAQRQEGETYFQSVGATGNGTATGNAGYITLNSSNAAGTAVIQYYIWVTNQGKLAIASYPTVSTYSSFPSGDWRGNDSVNGFTGTIVGGQS